MQALVARLSNVLRAYADKYPPTRLVDAAGCTTTQLDALEARIGWKLPAGYRAFLALTDGLRLDDGYQSVLFDLYSSSSLPVERDDNQLETLAEDDIKLDDIVIVGHVFMHQLYVFFDKTTGETVEWCKFDAERFADFEQFLAAEAESLAAVI
jgi:hypothetical protein